MTIISENKCKAISKTNNSFLFQSCNVKYDPEWVHCL